MSTEKTLAQNMAALVADLYRLSGSHIRAPMPILSVVAQGDPLKIGMCTAAVALQSALRKYPEGLAALGDFLDKPRLNDSKGE